MKIVAKSSDTRYMIADESTRIGRIVDLDEGVVYPPQPVDSIVKFGNGFWQNCDHDPDLYAKILTLKWLPELPDEDAPKVFIKPPTDLSPESLEAWTEQVANALGLTDGEPDEGKK